MARRVRGVLAVENVQTGDGRVIQAGALTWAPLPLPLGWLRDGDQHVDLVEVAPQVGTIDSITRTGDDIEFTGTLDDEQPDGAELARRLDAGTAALGSRVGISIDPDNWAVQYVATDAQEDDGAEGVLILAAAGRGQLPLQSVTQAAAVSAAAGDPDPGDEGTVLLFEDRVDSVLERYTMLRIRGATACAVAAFDGAFMELDGSAPAEDEAEEGDETDAAEGTEADPNASVHAPALVSSAPSRPPSSWFAIPEPELHSEGMVDVYGMPAQELLVEQPDGGLGVPIVFTDDGRVFGHAARWGQCHVGYTNECITAPPSAAAYAHFHHGAVVCDDGTMVATGTLTMSCDHAAAELRAPEARDHYAHSGMAFADVRATNGALGVWVSGVLRPDVTEAQLRVLRASSLSGDWRRIGTDLEFIAALAVNVPGFPIAREYVTASGLVMPDAALVASAWMDDGVPQSLVASGVVQRCPECQRRAMAASAGESDLAAAVRQLSDAVDANHAVIERRTRHLVPAAAEYALRGLRR